MVEGFVGDTTPGTYTVNVQPVTIATQPLTLGSTVSGSIAVTGEQDRYTFTLPQTSLVYFDSLTNANFFWTLTGPAGTAVNNRQISSDAGQPVLNLPAGDYALDHRRRPRRDGRLCLSPERCRRPRP